MRKLVLAALLAVLSSGCAIKVNGQTYLLLQRSVVVSIVHTCSHEALVSIVGKEPKHISGPRPQSFVLTPLVVGERYIQVNVQSLNEHGEIAYTHVASFYIDYNSSTAQTWILSEAAQSSGGGILHMY